MNETLFEIFTYLFYILIAIVFRYLIPYVKLRLEDSKYVNVLDMIEKGINAAESIYKGMSGSGEQKKEFVMEFVMKYVEKHKIDISEDQVEILLEAIFNELDSVTINKHK